MEHCCPKVFQKSKEKFYFNIKLSWKRMYLNHQNLSSRNQIHRIFCFILLDVSESLWNVAGDNKAKQKMTIISASERRTAKPSPVLKSLFNVCFRFDVARWWWSLINILPRPLSNWLSILFHQSWVKCLKKLNFLPLNRIQSKFLIITYFETSPSSSSSKHQLTLTAAKKACPWSQLGSWCICIEALLYTCMYIRHDRRARVYTFRYCAIHRGYATTWPHQ